MTLNQLDFRQVVQNAPLFAIDLVVLNEKNQILVGLRKHAPAQGFWFVPGGRVFKNEPLDDGFSRIAAVELNRKMLRSESKMLGLYEHFYQDSFFGAQVSTHYINATHLVRLDSMDNELPVTQHELYRWIDIDMLEADVTVHQYSKVFLPELFRVLSLHQSTTDSQ